MNFQLAHEKNAVLYDTNITPCATPGANINKLQGKVGRVVSQVVQFFR